MNNSQSITRAESSVEASVSAELSKTGVTCFAVASAAVGCWATACLFAGTISSGGPMGMLSALMTTITG